MISDWQFLIYFDILIKNFVPKLEKSSNYQKKLKYLKSSIWVFLRGMQSKLSESNVFNIQISIIIQLIRMKCQKKIYFTMAMPFIIPFPFNYNGMSRPSLHHFSRWCTPYN